MITPTSLCKVPNAVKMLVFGFLQDHSHNQGHNSRNDGTVPASRDAQPPLGESKNPITPLSNVTPLVQSVKNPNSPLAWRIFRS